MNNKYSIKYTGKIKSFLDHYLHNEHEKIIKLYDYNNNKIIKKFIEIFRNQSESYDIKMIESVKIDKLHSYEDNSLLHVILSNVIGNESEYSQHFNNKKSFYNWIRENASMISITDDKYSDYHDILFNPCKNRKELHKIMYNGIFVSADVLHHSESEDLNYKIYSNLNTEIHVYHPDSNEGPDIQIIMRIINFYRTLLNSDIFVKISLFYGEQKKYLSEIKKKPICSDNVNSGASIKKELVHIWRKEEFYKVLIHELVHYFGVDFYISDSIYKKLNKHFNGLFTIEGIDRVNESYTEILAIVIHSCLYSVLKNIDFTNIFCYELLFSYFQVGKILNHFECLSYEDISKTTFIQKTSAFSYYIIKCMFMVNLKKILDFWEENDFTILKSESIQSNYYELYKDIVKYDSLDKEIINNVIQLLSCHNTCFVTKTMRMTMFQI